MASLDKRSPKVYLVLFLSLLVSSLASASDEAIVVVLSSNLKPYQEALNGVKKEFDGNIPTFVLSNGEPEIPRETKVVIAIGGKAALYSYPDRARLIYCL